MKLFAFSTPKNASDDRLFSYAKRMLPEVPEYALREAFQKRDVKVNGQRVGLDAQLAPGAEVRIYTRDFATKVMKIPVLFEDENVLVVQKPAGISCEADAKSGLTLPQLLRTQMHLPTEPLLCHRLDNPTEGLLLLAKTQLVQTALQDAFRERRIHKEYICVVRGTPVKPHDCLEAWLHKDAKQARVQVRPTECAGWKRIITEYTVLQAGACARLMIQLHTGRTHQIRAHMASIGHPLLGDDQYGDRAFNRSQKCRRLMLCATRLTFELEGMLSYLNEYAFTCDPTF